MEYARANNVSLLNLMNSLTLELERVAGAKASQLRLIQAVAIVLAVVNFIIILWHFLGQLRRSDQALDAARKETQHILSTVNEGLFLLDKTCGWARNTRQNSPRCSVHKAVEQG